MSNSRGPSRQVTLADVRGVLRGLDDAGDLPAKPNEITDALDQDTTPTTVRNRLEELENQGQVRKHDAGPGYVWDLVPDASVEDADITNQIAAILDAADPEDIPKEEARWIAENLPAADLSDEKKLEIVETIDPESFSDEKLREIIESASPELFPDEKAIEIIESVEIDVDDFPDETAEDIVSIRYEYPQTYWADAYRAGRNAYAIIGILVVLLFATLALRFRFGPYQLPNVAGVSLPTLLIEAESVALVLFLIGFVLFFVGSPLLVLGVLGHRYSSVKDPRPWSQYIVQLIKKRVLSRTRVVGTERE